MPGHAHRCPHHDGGDLLFGVIPRLRHLHRPRRLPLDRVEMAGSRDRAGSDGNRWTTTHSRDGEITTVTRPEK
jgi:hypothetical protein